MDISANELEILIRDIDKTAGIMHNFHLALDWDYHRDPEEAVRRIMDAAQFLRVAEDRALSVKYRLEQLAKSDR